MALLDTIVVDSNGSQRIIELHQGDLTNLTPEDHVDILVVSAFPDDYIPTPTSLVGALYRKGISVEELSRDKSVDLRTAFSCWLSQHTVSRENSIQFDRILCFEPQYRGDPPEVVGDIFRALAPFVASEPPVKTIAMPLVAAGDQGHSIKSMLAPLIEASIKWLSIGLPLEKIKIFTYSTSQAAVATSIFQEIKNTIAPPAPTKASNRYDVFISYSRKDREAGERLAEHLKQSGKRIFL